MSREIKLTQGKTAIVDDEDYEWLNQIKWHAQRSKYTWYAVNCSWVEGKPLHTKMHRLILGAKPGEQVDHRDHDGLNNRRSNIRTATKIQNMGNMMPNTGSSSKFKGVYIDKSTGRWKVAIQVNKRPIYLGKYQDETEAARMYDTAALKHFGDFALTNAQIFGI